MSNCLAIYLTEKSSQNILGHYANWHGVNEAGWCTNVCVIKKKSNKFMMWVFLYFVFFFDFLYKCILYSWVYTCRSDHPITRYVVRYSHLLYISSCWILNSFPLHYQYPGCRLMSNCPYCLWLRICLQNLVSTLHVQVNLLNT